MPDRPVDGIRDLLGAAELRLAGAGVASPRVDAELLLAFTLGLARGQLIMAPRPSPAQAARYQSLLDRRAAREPLQHLLGSAAFRHLELAVGPGVFVPRPETESLVDLVAPALRAMEAPVVVDLCAGSGALGLAIHQEFPASRVVAVERSQDALVWLRANASSLAPDERFRVLVGDVGDVTLTEGALSALTGRVDVVVANPPYVPSASAVDVEVAHDPAEAVFAGPHGLDLMPAVFTLAARLLRPGGLVAVEHSESHAAALVDLVASAGAWASVTEHVDLAGRDRFVTALRRPG